MYNRKNFLANQKSLPNDLFLVNHTALADEISLTNQKIKITLSNIKNCNTLLKMRYFKSSFKLNLKL